MLSFYCCSHAPAASPTGGFGYLLAPSPTMTILLDRGPPPASSYFLPTLYSWNVLFPPPPQEQAPPSGQGVPTAGGGSSSAVKATATTTTSLSHCVAAPFSFGRRRRPRSFPPLDIAHVRGLAVTYGCNNNVPLLSLSQLLRSEAKPISDVASFRRHRYWRSTGPTIFQLPATIAGTQQFMALSFSPLFILYHRRQPTRLSTISEHRSASDNDSSVECSAAATATATYDFFAGCGGGPWTITKTVVQLFTTLWGRPALWTRLLRPFTQTTTKTTAMAEKKQQQSPATTVPSPPPVPVKDSSKNHDGGIHDTAPNNGNKAKLQEEEAASPAASVADDPLASAVRPDSISELSTIEGEKNLPTMDVAVLRLFQEEKKEEIAVAAAGKSTNEETGTLEESFLPVLGTTSNNNTTAISFDEALVPSNKRSNVLSGEGIRTGGFWRSWGDVWGTGLTNVQSNLRKQLRSVTFGHMILLHAFLFWTWMTYLATVIVLNYTLAHQHHHHRASTH